MAAAVMRAEMAEHMAVAEARVRATAATAEHMAAVAAAIAMEIRELVEHTVGTEERREIKAKTENRILTDLQKFCISLVKLKTPLVVLTLTVVLEAAEAVLEVKAAEQVLRPAAVAVIVVTVEMLEMVIALEAAVAVIAVTVETVAVAVITTEAAVAAVFSAMEETEPGTMAAVEAALLTATAARVALAV